MSSVAIMGAGGRIGRSLVSHLVSNGKQVLALDTDISSLQQDLNTSDNFLPFEVDLYEIPSLEGALRFGSDSFGSIDAAIYTAYPKSKGWGSRFEDLTAENLFEDSKHQIAAPILFAQSAVSLFREQGHGNLIFVSSIQGVSSPKFSHYEGTEMVSPVEYSMGKSAIISATRYLAKYLGNEGIRVNSLSPGGIADNQNEKFTNKYRSDTLSKGLLDPEDLLGAFDFLLSESSKYVNGQNLIVDDGWTL